MTVEVLDAQGRVHPKADDLIVFSLEGEGSLTAVGNSNPVSTESYTGDRRRAFRGRCLAVVKSNGKAGAIRLRAEAEGLEPAETIITAG